MHKRRLVVAVMPAHACIMASIDPHWGYHHYTISLCSDGFLSSEWCINYSSPFNLMED